MIRTPISRCQRGPKAAAALHAFSAQPRTSSGLALISLAMPSRSRAASKSAGVSVGPVSSASLANSTGSKLRMLVASMSPGVILRPEEKEPRILLPFSLGSFPSKAKTWLSILMVKRRTSSATCRPSSFPLGMRGGEARTDPVHCPSLDFNSIIHSVWSWAS